MCAVCLWYALQIIWFVNDSWLPNYVIIDVYYCSYAYQMKSKRATTTIPIKAILTGTTIAATRSLALRVLPLGAAAVETSLTEWTVMVIDPVVMVCTEAVTSASGIWLVMAFTVLTERVYILPGKRSEENVRAIKLPVLFWFKYYIIQSLITYQ